MSKVYMTDGSGIDHREYRLFEADRLGNHARGMASFFLCALARVENVAFGNRARHGNPDAGFQ